jgi:hypothetical protein
MKFLYIPIFAIASFLSTTQRVSEKTATYQIARAIWQCSAYIAAARHNHFLSTIVIDATHLALFLARLRKTLRDNLSHVK